jgi:antitoxin ParD1/3/4
MHVTLTPEQEEIIRQQLHSGKYLTASEVVDHALRLLAEHDWLDQHRFEELRQAIQKGIDSGPAEPLDMREVKRKGQALLAGHTADRPS